MEQERLIGMEEKEKSTGLKCDKRCYLLQTNAGNRIDRKLQFQFIRKAFAVYRREISAMLAKALL